MIRNLQDVAYASGAVASGLTSAFQSAPDIEGFDAKVLDSRASGSAAKAIGTLWIEAFTAANPGDAQYIPSATAAQPVPMFSYGVMTLVPPPSAPAAGTPLVTNVSTGQNEIRIRQKGTCLALCTTTGTPIAVGTPLAADGAGNLTPTASTTPGVVLAIAKGTLGTSQGATLVLVSVGGY